jgi:hypothetical protein
MQNWAPLFVALASIDMVFASASRADPSHNTSAVALAFCDNGEEVLLNFGTVTNRSHQSFVLASSGSGTISADSIYVVQYLAFTDSTGTSVVFDTAPGLKSQNAVTCTSYLTNVIVTARGFFTPSGTVPSVKTTSSRLLCESYGGKLESAPDEVLGSTNPVIWVCNDFPVPFDETFFNKLYALAIGCLADGGVVVYGTVTQDGAGSVVGVMDTTCYGPG